MHKKSLFRLSFMLFAAILSACNDESDTTTGTTADKNSIASGLGTQDSLNPNHITGMFDTKEAANLELVRYLNRADGYNRDELTSTTEDEPDLDYSPVAEYAYVAAGNYIEMYKMESNGNLVSIGSVTPDGIPSTAKISSIAISPNHLNVYATIQNGSNDDKIWSLGLNAVNGRLTPLAKALISTKKHSTSSVAVSRNSLFVYTTDSTKICTYQIKDNYGTLPESATFCVSPLVNDRFYPYGQIKLSANGKYAFVSGGESLNTIFTLKRESNGSLTEVDQLDTKVNNNLSMAIPESGGFMYTALKGNYSAGQYRINGGTGIISPLSPQTARSGTESAEPHAVVLTPRRRYAYVTNYHDNTIAIFNINESGTLQPSPRTVVANGNPDKITMDKTGSFIYVSTKDKHILQYAIDRETGDLTPLANPAISIWESSANIAVTDIEGLHMSVVSPVYTHDVPLDTKYVVDFSNGYTESSVRAAGNIIACQVEESKYHPESMAQVSASTLSGGVSCPSGSSSVMVGDIFDLSPTQLAIGFVGLYAAHQVMIYFTNIQDSFGNTYPDREIVVDTTVPHNMMTSPESGATNVSTHSHIYFTFTENIKPDSPHNKITVTYNKDGVEIEMANMGVRAGGTTLEGEPGELPFGTKVNIEAKAETASGAIATASATITTTEESKEKKLMIYATAGRFTGDLKSRDPSYPVEDRTALGGADYLCNNDSAKPAKPEGANFKALLLLSEFNGEGEQLPGRYPPNGGGFHDLKAAGDDWVMKANTPYYDIYGRFIATTNSLHVFSTYLRSAIGANVLNAWTGVFISLENSVMRWTPAVINDCNYWTSASVEKVGRYGIQLSRDPNEAFSYAEEGCNKSNVLYCVQQDE